jgi:GT2 family glycosyltransferase
MKAPPDLSLVVPTYNRRASLLRLLASLESQTFPAGRLEVVVVDNASTDGTRDAIERHARTSRLALRCVGETRQGASHARNRGIAETTAPIVVFTDDDIETDESWLEEIMRAFAEHPEAHAVGGRTEPIWETALPPWWQPNYEHAFLYNWGEEPCIVTREPFFFTHNLAVKREVLAAIGIFDTRLGPKGRRYLAGEDVDLGLRIRDGGGVLWYWPRAVVRHHVSSERLTRAYFRRRFYARGENDALRRSKTGKDLHLRYQCKVLLQTLGRWVLTRDASARFRSELSAWWSIAYLIHGVACWFRPQRAPREGPHAVAERGDSVRTL